MGKGQGAAIHRETDDSLTRLADARSGGKLPGYLVGGGAMRWVAHDLRAHLLEHGGVERRLLAGELAELVGLDLLRQVLARPRTSCGAG